MWTQNGKLAKQNQNNLQTVQTKKAWYQPSLLNLTITSSRDMHFGISR
ncbi:hypothetical protein VCHENC03_1832 [Vibrio sp. HENC-03]|nr:hypothetical protein VCHENC03_1832 [Vibrio sp. HENC-03]